MSYVQSKSKDSGAVTSDTMAFTSNIAAGSTLVAGVRVGAPGRALTLSDDKSNTWNNTATQDDGTSGDGTTMGYAQNVASGATTVTASISGAAASLRWAIAEYGSMAAASFDQTAAALGSSTTPSSGNTAATAQATETLVGFISNGDTTSLVGTISAGTNYTRREHVIVSGVDKCALEDRDVSATGAYAADATFDHTDLWTAIIITLKAATGGGTKAPPPFGGSRQQFTKPRRRLLFHETPDFEASDRAIERRAA